MDGDKEIAKEACYKNQVEKKIVQNRMFSGHCVVQIDFCKVLILSGSEGWIGFCSEKNGP